MVTDQHPLRQHMLLMSQIINQARRNTQWTFHIQFAAQEVEIRSARPRVALQRLTTVSHVPSVPVSAPARQAGSSTRGSLSKTRPNGIRGRRLRPFDQPLNDPLGCSCAAKQLQCPSHLSLAERLVLTFGPVFCHCCSRVWLLLLLLCFFYVLMDCPTRAATYTLSLCDTHRHKKIWGKKEKLGEKGERGL